MKNYYLLDNPNPYQHFYEQRHRCRHGYEDPHLIVLHTSENLPDYAPPDVGAESLARYASTTTRAVSWHYSVDSDSIIRMLPLDYTAFHVRNYNSCSIGIEMATKHDAWLSSPVEWLHGMYDNMADVLAEISEQQGIPLLDRRNEPHKWGVTTHSVLDPTRRRDPGPAFPFSWVLEMGAGGFRYAPKEIPCTCTCECECCKGCRT